MNEKPCPGAIKDAGAGRRSWNQPLQLLYLTDEEKGFSKRKKDLLVAKSELCMFSPVLIPHFCTTGKNQRLKFSQRTAGGKLIPSTSGSAARWTDIEVEQEVEF